ncbi:MAG: hypothetical protein ABF278_04545 [Wenyingzhuangia sp.]|uniref:hypothetical protein n=1 Tax=Wenyingzhuangia sp. TaxID=1964193 RepID=UPI0032199731
MSQKYNINNDKPSGDRLFNVLVNSRVPSKSVTPNCSKRLRLTSNDSWQQERNQFVGVFLIWDLVLLF